MGYIKRKAAKIGAKLRRFAYAPRITHPAFVHPLIGVEAPALERLHGGPPPDDALLERIAAAYRKARPLNTSATPSMWDEHAAARARLAAALEASDLADLRGQFVDLFGGCLLDGMSHGNRMFADEALNPYSRGFVGLRTLDCLHSLAEATGARPIPSFAQHGLIAYVALLNQDPGRLLAEVQEALGFPLDMPAAGAPYVCRLGGVATAPDVLRHAYIAHRLTQLGLGPEARVLEVGGGFGMAALCARRAGIGRFTIIDLPFVGAIQMAYLGGVLGAAEVSALGEAEAPVRLLPPDAIADLPDDSFDIVINCDSLPEMGRETAAGYIRQFRRLAPRFLSVNQEAQKVHGGLAQNLVPALVEAAGGFRRLHRFRYWMEQGYVEELYERR
ncbi:putative sugar O-methyltransferase [Novispirillum sp. DQ9]|uniref:putative sugar O-methyltransferase n=1 Tax=Novispirillum sp. DQ9 TaxID=3398612 RepID=UPI003C7B03E8